MLSWNDSNGWKRHWRFRKFIILCNFYHMNRCEIAVDSGNCKFFMNLKYLYTENLVSGQNIEKLQKYCRFNYGNFYSMRTMLCSLEVIENRKSELNEKFEKTLKLWNAKNIKIKQKNNMKKYLGLIQDLIFFLFW